MIGPTVEVRVVQFLGNYGLEFEITSPNRPERTSLVVMCRGKNRFVDDLHIPDPRNNLTSSELLSEQANAKESEPCSTEMKQCSIEAIRADSVNNHEGKKVKEYSCLPIIQMETSFNRDLEIGHENCTPL